MAEERPKKIDYNAMQQKMIDWLFNSDIIDEKSNVYSWLNPTKKGYVYEETMGYYIKLGAYLSHLNYGQKYVNIAEKVAKRIEDKMIWNSIKRSKIYGKNWMSYCIDGAERNDIVYTFDSFIIYSGIFSLPDSEKHLCWIYSPVLDLCGCLRHKLPGYAPKRGKGLGGDVWSLSYGSHLLKMCMPLNELCKYPWLDGFLANNIELTGKLLDDLIPSTYDHGHFHINGKSNYVYTHSHCYATEGLLYLLNRPEYPQYHFIEKDKLNPYSYLKPIVESSAAWLAEKQNDDGSLYNWYDRKDAERAKQADATAQSIRIWQCVDKGKYAGSIKRGFEFLKALQSPEGGIYYNDQSKDVNSWATIFAIQALEWQLNKPEPEWLI